MNKLKFVATFVVTLAVSASLIAVPSHAETVTLVKKPTISIAKLGGVITAKPAIWSAKVSSKFTWLINGKNQSSAKGLTLPSPAKKGSVVQIVESYGGISASSNKVIIGGTSLNGFPEITFKDTSQSVMTVILPKFFPSNAKISYQWFSGPFEVKGAKSPEYKIATGDQGGELSLQINLTAKGLTTNSYTSNSVDIPVSPRTYNLIWSENFQNQAKLDSQIWKPENGDGTEYKLRGWGNKERQYYLDSQVSFDSQSGLNIKASRSGAEKFNCYYGTQCEWLSAKFVTKGRLGFKYGRIETRVKGPVGNGSWGAVWMLGANIDERPWPGCGEIDIVELLGREPKTVYGTPHGPASGQSYTTEIDAGFASEYHTYAIDWLPDQITWYLDGKPYGVLNRNTLVDFENTWIFDHEFYLLMNLAMGGTFGGEIDSKMTNSNMSIQWIRFSTINGIGEVIKH
ncbi:MAG: hypothetical protein RIT08_585 [Actinomycetota bacterium]